MEYKLEDKEICAKCGGRCCKKCGCDYVSKDFESMSIDYLQKRLEEGNISIVATFCFDRLKNGKLTCVPFLYLRARNINRPIVDLLSLKTTCSMLKEDGCYYDLEKRPGGAKNLVLIDGKCHPLENQLSLIYDSWKDYQKILSRLVRRINGCSVDEQLSLDVEKLFKDIKDCNFEGVSKQELEEMTEFIPLLSSVYEDEFKRAIDNNKPKIISLNSLLKKLNDQTFSYKGE